MPARGEDERYPLRLVASVSTELCCAACVTATAIASRSISSIVEKIHPGNWVFLDCGPSWPGPFELQQQIGRELRQQNPSILCLEPLTRRRAAAPAAVRRHGEAIRQPEAAVLRLLVFILLQADPIRAPPPRPPQAPCGGGSSSRTCPRRGRGDRSAPPSSRP